MSTTQQVTIIRFPAKPAMDCGKKITFEYAERFLLLLCIFEFIFLENNLFIQSVYYYSLIPNSFNFSLRTYATLAFVIGSSLIYAKNDSECVLYRQKAAPLWFIIFYTGHLLWSIYIDLYIMFFKCSSLLGLIFGVLKLAGIAYMTVILKNMPLKPTVDFHQNTDISEQTDNCLESGIAERTGNEPKAGNSEQTPLKMLLCRITATATLLLLIADIVFLLLNIPYNSLIELFGLIVFGVYIILTLQYGKEAQR